MRSRTVRLGVMMLALIAIGCSEVPDPPAPSRTGGGAGIGAAPANKESKGGLAPKKGNPMGPTDVVP